MNPHPRRSPAVPARRPLAAVVALLVAVGLALAAGMVAASAQESALEGGSIVVSQSRDGSVVVVEGGDEIRPLASGLTLPRGLAVLEDQSVLIAETGANQIVAVGGRFGDRPAKVTDFPSPEALTLAGPDTLIVSSYNSGLVSRVDLRSFEATTIADGLDRPTGVAVRGDDIYVAEAGASRVLRIAPDQEPVEFATGVGAPTGMAAGPGDLLYVSDYSGNRVLSIAADGAVSTFVEEADLAPVGIGIDPVAPRPDELYVIAVNTKSGLVLYGADGTPVERTGFPESSAVGLAVVPGGSPPLSRSGESGTTAPPDTAPAPTTPLVVPVERSEAEGGSYVPLVVAVVVVLLVAAAAAAAFVYSQRNRTEEDAGFPEHDGGAWGTVTQAMGPCASQEVDLAEAETATKAAIDQRLAAERRLAIAREFADRAREREATASARRDELRTRRLAQIGGDAGDEDGDDGGEGAAGLDLSRLGLTTEAGRTALQAFGRQEITATELRQRWEQLGEHSALAALQGESDRLARKMPWPEEREADLAAHQAQSDLEQSERDQQDATADIERLRAREVQCEQRLQNARKALDDCHDRQRQADEDAAVAAALALATEKQEAARKGAPTGPAPSGSPTPPAGPPPSAPPPPAPSTPTGADGPGAKAPPGKGGAAKAPAGEGGAAKAPAGKGEAAKAPAGEGGAAKAPAGKGEAAKAPAGNDGGGDRDAGKGAAARGAASTGPAATTPAAEDGAAGDGRDEVGAAAIRGEEDDTKAPGGTGERGEGGDGPAGGTPTRGWRRRGGRRRGAPAPGDDPPGPDAAPPAADDRPPPPTP